MGCKVSSIYDTNYEVKFLKDTENIYMRWIGSVYLQYLLWKLQINVEIKLKRKKSDKKKIGDLAEVILMVINPSYHMGNRYF